MNLEEKSWLGIIGDRASGKTTLAPRLAEEMGMPWFDLDEVIAARVGRDHHSFFRIYGERRFREQEELALHDLPRSPIILACGGGICSNQPAMKVLIQKARFLYLNIPQKILLERRKAGVDQRPLLKNFQSVEEEIESLYQSRKETYLRYAQWVVEWEGEDREGMVRKILNRWKNANGV